MHCSSLPPRVILYYTQYIWSNLWLRFISCFVLHILFKVNTIWTGFETWRLTAPANSQRPAEAEGQTCWSFLSSSLFISLVITLGLINAIIYFVGVICIPPPLAVLSICLPLPFSSVWSPELVWLFLIILLVFEWTSSTQCKRLKSKIGSIFHVVNSKFKTIWKKKANILISETYLLDCMRRTKNDVIFNLARLVSFIQCPLSSIRLGGRVMKILVGHNRPKTFWSWTLGIKNSLMIEILLSWAHIITKSTRMKVFGFPAGSRIEDQVVTNLSWESIVSPRGVSRLLTDVENLMWRSGGTDVDN